MTEATLTVAAGQFAPTGDRAANRASIAQLARGAVAGGADILVLPEESMVLSDAVVGELGAIARREWEGFVAFLSDLARSSGLAIVGSGYEGSGGERPFNTVVAVETTGDVVGRYRKLHLYDAFGYRESDYVRAGDGGPVVVRLAGTNVGLITCYDIRFPELSRALIDGGAELLVLNAAWTQGPLKESHWHTLVRARAIENTVWVVAAGSAASDCIGQSMIVDPSGIVRVALGGDQCGLAVGEISQQRTDDVRAVLPVLENRRLTSAVSW